MDQFRRRPSRHPRRLSDRRPHRLPEAGARGDRLRRDDRTWRGGRARRRHPRRRDPRPVRQWYGDRHRSEEHTSELQSLMRISYAVFCLKKKKEKKKRNEKKTVIEHEDSLEKK